MRKGLKILSTSFLLSTLVLAGCSCNKDDNKKDVSRIENAEDKILNNLTDQASNYNLLTIYNALIASDAGNKVVANKLIEFVASEVLDINNTTSVWKTRYDALVKEKLEELAKSDKYLVKDEFSEKYMIEALTAEGYKITCETGVTYGTPEALACNYNDYINKAVKVDVLNTLLKEKYILDVSMKDRKNLLTNKKIRDVEYFSVSASIESNYEDLSVRDFIREIRDRIANKEVVDFAAVESELKQKLKDIVTKEYEKINTSADYNQSIASKYTNGYTQNKEVGYAAKLEEIDNASYTDSKLISSDSATNAVISDAITSSLLSITNPTDATFARKVVAVEDNAETTHYYLISANANSNADAKDVLISEIPDGSKYTYSIVRFTVINSETTDETKVYEAIKLLAKESTLATGALNHYVKEKRDLIAVYDDDVYEYLSSLYPEVFTE